MSKITLDFLEKEMDYRRSRISDLKYSRKYYHDEKFADELIDRHEKMLAVLQFAWLHIEEVNHEFRN